MEYYIYISDAKLDMLYPQVPHDLKKKVATKLGIDLKLVTATRQSDSETEENRFTKLQAVVDYIREHEDVGTIDAPGEFIEDTLSMRSAQWGLPVKPGRGPFVYFGGCTQSTQVGLWGAMNHVLGSGNINFTMSTSCATFVIWELIQRLDPDAAWDEPAAAHEGLTQHLLQVARGFKSQKINAFNIPSGHEIMAVKFANSEMHGNPQQRMHFMAKRLASAPGFVLGTPLFVAL